MPNIILNTKHAVTHLHLHNNLLRYYDYSQFKNRENEPRIHHFNYTLANFLSTFSIFLPLHLPSKTQPRQCNCPLSPFLCFWTPSGGKIPCNLHTTSTKSSMIPGKSLYKLPSSKIWPFPMAAVSKFRSPQISYVYIYASVLWNRWLHKR